MTEKNKDKRYATFTHSLFTIISEQLNKSQIEVYTQYLKKALAAEGNLNIDLLSNSQISNFYSSGVFSLPKYFNPIKLFDVTRLIDLLPSPVVIYKTGTGQIYYDNRVLFYMAQETLCTIKPIFISIDEQYNCSIAPKEFKNNLANIHLIQKRVYLNKLNIISALNNLFGQGGHLQTIPFYNYTYSRIVPDILVNSEAVLEEYAKFHNIHIIIVIHSFSNIVLSSYKKNNNPYNNLYTTVFEYGRAKDTRKMILLDQSGCNLSLIYNEQTVSILEAQKRWFKCYKPAVSHFTTADELRAKVAKEYIESGNTTNVNCTCSICLQAISKFGLNIKCHAGPQRKLVLRHSLLDYAELFNMKETIPNILKCYRLTLQSTDIESCPVPVNTFFPQEVKDQNKKACLSGCPELFSNQEVSKQRPILFANQAMSTSGGLPIKYYWCRDKEDTYTVFSKYIIDLANDQIRIFKEKMELLAPFINHLSPLKKAHFTFCAKKNIDYSETHSSWNAGIWGKLENTIIRHLKTTKILTFHGAGYDLVIFSSIMSVLSLKIPNIVIDGIDPNTQKLNYNIEEIPFNISISKKGNKVTNIKIVKTGISMFDVKQMIGPGLSLKKFATLVNLNLSKGKYNQGLYV
jgi:hypothetical protein